MNKQLNESLTNQRS